MTAARRTPLRLVTSAATLALLAALAAPGTANDGGDPAVAGRFNEPFVEPDIFGTETDDNCIPRDDGFPLCKPSAGSIAVMPDGGVLYWSALEGTENIEFSTVGEFGTVAENDQTRVLRFGADGPQWSMPFNVRAEVTANPKVPLLPVGGELIIDESYERNADGALFGSDQVWLADGRLLVASGTDYYTEAGAAELEGLRQTRVYDPVANRWEQVGDLTYGRWYPTLVTLKDGQVLAFSGVQKIIKPVYLDQKLTNSGRNVPQVEVFDPETGTWGLLPITADRSLPQYPRMRLLPNGDVWFNVSGQSFVPGGEAFDEALWNIGATLDPETATWTELGVPGLGELGPDEAANVGYRGSTFTAMLPLRPDADGDYGTVELLQAGGTLFPTPGSYVAIADSRVISLDVSGEETTLSTRATEPLATARWFGHATVLPTGEVLVTSGGDKDAVIGPGTEIAITEAELFDPTTETWSTVAEQHRPRTYHNSGVLLPDGTVLVGGHNPIPTLYGSHRTLPGGFAENEGRDPSFEIYEPPYLFRGERPVIRTAPSTLAPGESFRVQLGTTTDVASVMLVRHTAETHIIDGDQRAVELAVTKRAGRNLTVVMPDNGNVVPPGPYMLFVNGRTDEGLVPSEAALVTVTADGDVVAVPTIDGANESATDSLAAQGEQVSAAVPVVIGQVTGANQLSATGVAWRAFQLGIR